MTKIIDKSFSLFWEILKSIIIALIIVIPIRYFLFQPFLVRGASMEPNFQNNDYLIIDMISYRFRRPSTRGEVVVFRAPNNPFQKFIKRIIGLPGETIEIRDGEVLIHLDQDYLVLDESDYLYPQVKTAGNLKITLEENEYFVLGDNRTASSDSRHWGALPVERIIGRVMIRVWPFDAFGKIKAPVY